VKKVIKAFKKIQENNEQNSLPLVRSFYTLNLQLNDFVIDAIT